MKTLIAANWKMHGDLSWVAKPGEFRTFYPKDKKHVECLICPPAYMISAMVEQGDKHNVSIGAQNCHFEKTGAFTGEMSADMVADTGAGYVILGHSERRAIFGETDEIVAAKAQAVTDANLIPIVCIGESEDERRAGREIEIATSQLKTSIPDQSDGENLVIAYEPVWAIGTGLTPTLEDIEAMHDHIRELMQSRFDQKTGSNIQILYGGSVKPTNAKDILAIKNVNGALIGGAGLDMQSLAEIAQSA